MENKALSALREEIMQIPIFDAHSHIDAAHLSARGLHDILLYHMLITELYSVGCPDGARLSEEPDDAEIESRIERALPYVPLIENTSCFWICKQILRDLYGWEEPVTPKNWRRLHELIQSKYREAAWPAQIMKKANVEKINTEYWRRKDGRADEILYYALEWAFFARCQWNQYDTGLIELEATWDKSAPGSPLPVTISGDLGIKRRVRSLDDVHEAMRHYCDLIPFDKILCVNQSFSTDLRYRVVSDTEMSEAIKRRDTAGAAERDIYACYLLEYLLTEIEKRKKDAVVNVGIAAEPLPFETGTKLRDDSVFDFAALVSRHPAIDFHVFLASASHNQHFCTLSRELPNLYLIAYWWHNFFPTHMAHVIAERLEMLPVKKTLGFFTDAYCLDWMYGKSIFIRNVMAQVFGQKIDEGYYTREQALRFAKAVLHDSAWNALHVK
jgi:hypothetical protein